MTYTESERGEIRADLESMYRSGKVLLPERAETVAAAASGMEGVIGTVNARAAQMGDWPALRDVLDMSADCQNGMVRAVAVINDLAGAVIAQANAFCERDEYAQSVFDNLDAELRGDPAPLPPVPDAVDPGEVTEPGAPGHEANPDVQDPEDELEDRNDLLDVSQIFGDE